MKKYLALAVVLTFFVSGCCSIQEMDGTTSKSFLNCLKIAVEKVCGFTPADSKEAQAAKVFISGIAGVVGLAVSTVTINGVKIEMTQAKAEQLFDQVITAAQTGGCVILQNLQAAVAYFDQVQAAVVAQAAKEGVKAKLKAAPMPGLINLRIKAKM